MAMSLPFGACAQDGMEQFRRAVLRAPPLHFTVEPLVSTKANGSHSHGMRIHPVAVGHGPFSSHSTYDIWRRWEDCLRFQETLEIEYRRAALEKKRCLLQGKGVKGFNGIYKQDLASSWDSLPAGPDPNSIAQDLHQHIPTLTKRGTIFRPSQATVERRQEEFRSFLEALFSDSMPVLIQEIRAADLVTDFFGLWRRDHEKLRKSDPSHSGSDIFASYFPGSGPSLFTLASSPAISPANGSSFNRRRTSSSASAMSNESAVQVSSQRSRVDSDATKSIRQSRRRPSSRGSSDSSLSSSEDITDSHTSTSTPTIVGDDFLAFGHNPQVPSERRDSMFDSLAEEPDTRMLCSRPPREFLSSIPQRFWASATETNGGRESQLVPPACQQSDPEEGIGTSLEIVVPFLGFDRSVDEYLVRDSEKPSCANATDDLLEGLPPISGRHRLPASEANTSTLVSTNIGGAHDLSTSTPRRLSPSRPLITIPETPVNDTARDPDSDHAAPSPTTSTVSSTFTTSTTRTSVTSTSGCLTIKATHNDSIIMLRVSRDISLPDFRQKVYNKFTGQEGIPLSETFTVAFIPPSSLAHGTPPTLAGRGELQSVNDDEEWEHLLSATTSVKLILHILDFNFMP